MRKTKIICTLGPATADDGVIRALIRSGMNAARQNFSHGDHDIQRTAFERIKRIREELGLPVSVILDTKGPEVRVKNFREGKVLLTDGDIFILTTREVEGDNRIVSVTYRELGNDICAGTRILADDGLIELIVTEIKQDKDGSDIFCKVIHGGILSDNKSCNFPERRLSMPYLSERDIDDILFGVELGFDYIAASFVSRAEDVLAIRRLLDSSGGEKIQIISKIENREGVNNIDEILRVSDGIMVARGDMGVEIPYEEIPRIQKMLIKKARLTGKLVITATQMLESMTSNPRPTRAEAADVANAIYDGTGSVMLSGETAAGKEPAEAVRAMAKIAEAAERDLDYGKFLYHPENSSENITDAVSAAAVTAAAGLGAKAILTATKTGKAARFLSKFRPQQPVIGITSDQRTWRQLGLYWGVTPIISEEQNNTDETLANAVQLAKEKGLISRGDLVVTTTGVSGTANLMKIQVVT